MNARTHVSTERGFSLVEALVGIIILALGLLSLASAASLGLAQMTRARQDMQYFADVQQEMDSLVNRGWGKVSSGSTTIRGRQMTWTVTTLSPNSQVLKVAVRRRGYQNMNKWTSDTLVVYLAKGTPGS